MSEAEETGHKGCRVHLERMGGGWQDTGRICRGEVGSCRMKGASEEEGSGVAGCPVHLQERGWGREAARSSTAEETRSLFITSLLAPCWKHLITFQEGRIFSKACEDRKRQIQSQGQ